ncbi:type II restriction endonuclease [Hyphomicrobium sulfonivorans]|nr:type II restriction endonuclease [Hyphomicrobium sulfonivorans]
MFRRNRGRAMSDSEQLIEWLRSVCAKYEREPLAIYRAGRAATFPLKANSEEDLQQKLEAGGHFIALPKESAALANIVEVSLVDFLMDCIGKHNDISGARGTERGYPDIEITGPRFGDVPHALDVKVARRAKSGNQTQSRITLYTGNTYFRYPQVKWPGTFRPFRDYASHLDLIAIYTLNEDSRHRIDDLELIIQPAWRIASKQRSSTTREYLGAVTSISDLRAGKGEFESEAAFYAFWRKYPFKIGKAVQQQLDKLLASKDDN